MKELFVGTVLLWAFAMAASASPLIPAPGTHLANYSRDIIEVKKWGVPRGWSRGRKVGWRGLGMPTGQAKKMWR